MAENPTGKWFAGASGRNSDESAFLDSLRSRAAAWDVDGVAAEATSALAALAPFCALVDVPDLAIPRHTLLIAYWTGGPWAGRSGGAVLQGVWGDMHLLDDHSGEDPECLTVVGLDATPEQCAAWAAQWLLRQLQRPVVREDWLRRDEVVASTWRLNDTERILHREGWSIRRLRRGQPDQRTRVR